MKYSKQAQLLRVMGLTSVSASVMAVVLSPISVVAQESKGNQAGVMEELQVTGVRASIRKAEAVKQEAKNIVEAITTEDLGKFSDDSLADSLRRLPGVQVEEDVLGSAGDKVSIRGLGSQFVVATINGRTAWSSGTGEGRDLRSYNFSVIPSEVVSEVLVTKTPVADTVESGIGGSVDVRTLRPLDANFKDKNWISQIDARTESMNIGDEDWGTRLSGAVVGKNDAGTLGAYLAFNMSDLKGGKDRQEVRYRDNRTFFIDHNNNYIADPEEEYSGATTIRDVLFNPDRYELERAASSVAIQFEPNDNLSIVADALYTKADRINRRPNTRFDVDRFISKTDDILFAPEAIVLGDGGLGDLPYHTTYIDQNGIRCIDGDNIQSASCAKENGRLLSMRDQYRNNFRDSWIGGLNVDYEKDQWRVNGDIFYNTLDTEVNEISIDANTYKLGSPISAGVLGDDEFTVIHDPAELAHENFDARRVRIRQRENNGDQIGARLDFEVDIDNALIDSVQFGTRYNKSNFSYDVSQRAGWDDDGADQDAFNAAMWGSGFHDSVFGVALPDFNLGAVGEYLAGTGLSPDVDGGSEFGPCAAGNVSSYLSLNGSPANLLTDGCLELANSFNVDEETYSTYAAINFASEIGGIPVSANFGLRYIETKNSSTGVVSIALDDEDVSLDPNDIFVTEGSFSKLLPNLNVRLDLSDSLQIRLAASESLSRPDLFDITSRFKVSASDSDDDGDFTADDCIDGDCVIKQGNPDLEPYTAWNYDLTMMWAMPTDGFLAMSFYYKDIDGFIFDEVSGPVTLPEYGDAEFSVVQPSNASTAKVSGYEIALHQPFTFLPAPFDGLGAQLNYSYTDSDFSSELPEDIAEVFGGFGLPGASTHNANAVLYYEQGRFSARLAYVYRDAYFSSFNGGAEEAPRFIAEEEALSASMSFDITDNVEIKVQGSNLTEDGRREFTSFETQGTRYTSRPRSYSIGLRAKF